MKEYIKKTGLFKIIKKQQLMFLARYLSKQKEYSTSALLFKKALNKNSETKDIYSYAKVLYKSGEYKKSLMVLDRLIAKNKHKKSVLLKVQVLIASKELPNAEKLLREYIEKSANDALAHYLLGSILFKQKRWWQAEESFDNAKNLGYNTANFYRKFAKSSFEMNNYTSAMKLYDKAAKKWNKNTGLLTLSELYYHAGLSAEMINNESSDLYYEKATSTSTYGDKKPLTVGLLHESNNQYEKAEVFYKELIEHEIHEVEVLKRLSVIYIKQKKYNESIDAINKLIKIDSTDFSSYELLADSYYLIGNYDKAESLYLESMKRCNHFNIDLTIKYTKQLLKSGNTTESYKMLQAVDFMRSIENPSDLTGKELEDTYMYLYENLDIKNKIIVYESMHGKDITCNPYAILIDNLKNDKFKEYQHVVVANDKTTIDRSLLINKNLVVVQRNSFLYLVYLSSAMYLINNTSFPSYFIRKPDQKYLNTWHGTPWKFLGTDVKDSYTSIGNIQRNFLISTHMISQNKHTTEVLTDKYDIANIYAGMIAETGYPRNDVTLNMTSAKKEKIKSDLGLDSKKKIVFYAPTWRGDDVSSAEDQTTTIVEAITHLKKLDCDVIFRGHYFTSNGDANEVIENHSVKSSYTTNELLAITDILVTDYSSVLFDFIPTGKPTLYYLYDHEEYEEKRGLYFSYKDLPGRAVFSIDDLTQEVKDLVSVNSVPNKNRKTGIFDEHEDGNATKRTVDFFFNDNKDHVVDIGNLKKNILMHVGSFAPNGITSSAINLINSIDRTEYNVHILLNPKGIVHRVNNEELLDSLNENTHILSIAGKINSLDGKNYLESERYITPASEHDVFDHKYDREFDRLFGSNTMFDYAIEYDGYTRSMIWLFSSNRMISNVSKRSIYIHSMIYDEYINKYAYLDQVFKRYNKFDEIVSVSRPAMVKNREDIADKYGVDKSKFIYTDNIQDPEKIIKMSQEEISDKKELLIMNDGRQTFINIGRLSVEKGQIKLVKAFAKAYKKDQNIKLILIGDGPNAKRIKDLIAELGVKNSVYLFGYKSNPFKYLKRSDCFVLTSDYEGQGMVIYESFTLGVPVISTDNGVSHDIFQNGKYGILCDKDIDSISSAISDFSLNRNELDRFDVYKYNKNALDTFYNKVIG